MQFARSSSSSNSILKRPFDSAGNNESGRTQDRYDDVNEESSSDDDAYESDQYTLKRNDYSRDRQADDDTSMELREATVAVNVGMLLLQKMGWRDGLGLGATNQGRLEPVPSATNYGVSGIGKVSQDSRMLDSTTLLPRELESQAIARETPDQRLAREVSGRAAFCFFLALLTLLLHPSRLSLCAATSFAQAGNHVRDQDNFAELLLRDLQKGILQCQPIRRGMLHPSLLLGFESHYA